MTAKVHAVPREPAEVGSIANRVTRLTPGADPLRAATAATAATRAIAAVCGVSTLVYCLVYAMFPLVPAFAAALLLVMIAHLGSGAQWLLSTYGLQRETPDQFRGRVMSLDYGLATLLIGISSIAAGLLADAWGAETATWCLAALGGGYGIAWLAWSLVGPRAMAAPHAG
jgi:hypothetical protein